MDILKLIDLATRLKLPELASQAIGLVSDIRAAAERAGDVLSAADRAQLDAIHAEALATADRLDAALREAERR